MEETAPVQARWKIKASARQEAPQDLSDIIRAHGGLAVLLCGEEVVAVSAHFTALTGISLSHPLDLEALLVRLFADPSILWATLAQLRSQRRGTAPLTPVRARAALPGGPRRLELTAGLGTTWLLMLHELDTGRIMELREVLPGCAHDLNNVLTVLGHTSELLQGATPEHQDVLLSRRDSQLEHGRALTRAIAELSRGEGKRSLNLPNLLLQSFCDIYSCSVAGMSVRLVDTPDVGCIRVDRVQLDRILLNLVVNARNAAGPVGVSVELRQERWSAARVRAATGGALDAECVCISVSDDGPGIPEALHERVFERAFTTRAGAGLGLPTVRRLMSEHGGAALLQPGAEAGATFALLFPTAS